jgi:hypothetical protein
MVNRTCHLALIATLVGLVTSAVAQEGGDTEAQILYAYQTEATSRLDELRANLRIDITDSPRNATARYHLAHADYRSALLMQQNHKSAASAALTECIAQLTAIGKDGHASAETLALRGACSSLLARLGGVESVLYWRKSGADLAKANRLDPGNPRARLIRALDLAARPKAFGGDPALGFTELKAAAELFDNSPATRPDAPAWGHADAYLELGLALRAQNDAIGARNALEKALLAASESKRIKAALAEISK